MSIRMARRVEIEVETRRARSERGLRFISRARKKRMMGSRPTCGQSGEVNIYLEE